MAKPPEDWQQIIDQVLLSTVDPTVPAPFDQPGHMPALTTLMFRVCENDPKKFAEATRLVELFIYEALKTNG